MPNTTLEINDMLVVDPRPDDYLQLAAEVDATAYHLSFATSGDEALRMARRPSFALWLINFRLPDMTGAELLAALRSRNPDAACILISDIYSSTDELSARQLGATFYTCKPLSADWLRALPVFCKPVDRDHSAHGPPQSRASPPRRANMGIPHSTQQQSKS